MPLNLDSSLITSSLQSENCLSGLTLTSMTEAFFILSPVQSPCRLGLRGVLYQRSTSNSPEPVFMTQAYLQTPMIDRCEYLVR